MRKLAARIAKIIVFLFVCFVAATFFNMRPGDRALFPPEPEDVAIPVYVVSFGYHSGLILRRDDLVRASEPANLPAIHDVLDRFRDFDDLEFGWGEEGFYQHVRTLRDLQIGEALRALFQPGNKSVVHVVGLRSEPRAFYPSADIAQITISDRGFARLAAELDQSFARGADGHVEEIGPGLYGPSLFYHANGTFNLLNVCNHWVAHLLQTAGVPTNPFLATLPDGLFLDIALRAHIRALPR